MYARDIRDDRYYRDDYGRYARDIRDDLYYRGDYGRDRGMYGRDMRDDMYYRRDTDRDFYRDIYERERYLQYRRNLDRYGEFPSRNLNLGRERAEMTEEDFVEDDIENENVPPKVQKKRKRRYEYEHCWIWAGWKESIGTHRERARISSAHWIRKNDELKNRV